MDKTLFPNFIKSKIKLTIGILVSNNIKYIRKALDSIQPLLKAIPSELIVIDTVGNDKSDGSIEVAKEYTDKVFHFDWIDDFAAARNAILEHAKGEWFMYFDDDECFDSVNEFIEFFKSNECDRYCYATFYSRDYYSDNDYKMNLTGRMIKRTPKTRFVGIIHEHYNVAYGPIKEFKTFTHHYGYLYETKEQKEKKNARNIFLLEKELMLEGPNVWTCAHLVKQMFYNNIEDAVKKSSEFLETVRDKENLKTAIGQWLILVNFRYIADHDEYCKVIDLEKQTKEKYRLSEISQLVIKQIEATKAFSQGLYNEAAICVEDYFDLYAWLQNHQDERNQQVSMDLASFLQTEKLFSVAAVGLVSEAIKERYDISGAYLKYIDLQYCKEFLQLMSAKGFSEVIRFVINKAHSPEMATMYYKQLYKDEYFENPALKKYLPFTI